MPTYSPFRVTAPDAESSRLNSGFGVSIINPRSSTGFRSSTCPSQPEELGLSSPRTPTSPPPQAARTLRRQHVERHEPHGLSREGCVGAHDQWYVDEGTRCQRVAYVQTYALPAHYRTRLVGVPSTSYERKTHAGPVEALAHVLMELWGSSRWTPGWPLTSSFSPARGLEAPLRARG